MDIKKYMKQKNEKPLDNIVTNGGFCGIFRKIACIGDSLSSGEFESKLNGEVGYHDYYDYSWGQYLARDTGCTVLNFSKGGMTAKDYCESFAIENDLWNIEKRCQAYIIALGVNDVTQSLEGKFEFGSIDDIDKNDYNNNAETFAGWYAKIIQKYKENQPKAKFFLMTTPQEDVVPEKRGELFAKHTQFVNQLCELFDNCYAIDLYNYAPVYDKEFKENFYLAGHLNAEGYRLTALMVESYIDYIIRNNPNDFKQIGFVGTSFHHEEFKW